LTRQAIVASHIQQSDDPKVQLIEGFGIRAYACNPLLTKNRLIGTLSFGSRTRDEFTPQEFSFLETISHYVITSRSLMSGYDSSASCGRPINTKMSFSQPWLTN